MNPAQLAITAAGCVGQLALALIALRRSARSRLALPLGLLFLDVFAWNLASLLVDLSPQPAFAWLDHSASPLTAPLALAFVLAFVGEQRRFDRLRRLAWLPFGALSLVPTLGLFSPALHAWERSGGWAAALLVCSLAAMAFATARLTAHLKRSIEAHERARTRLLLAAAALGTALGITDLLGNFLSGLPSLGALGFFAAGVVTLVAATRERLLEIEVTLESAAVALALATVGVVAYLSLFHLLASHAALLVLATALVTLALVSLIQRLASAAAAGHARTVQLALLGRVAAQMTHDLKNPLAALKGAAQFLEQDLPKDGGRRAEIVKLMLAQIARLEAAIDGYRRLERIEPLRAELHLNELILEVTALQGLTAAGRVSLRTELAEGVPPCRADAGLLAVALENLIRNASEAIGDGEGSITVQTGLPERGEPGVLITVRDTGAGMDARTREQAFDELFTTKPLGSGLGLSFVRRVVEAHGGRVTLSSERGRGTVVRILLPLE